MADPEGDDANRDAVTAAAGQAPARPDRDAAHLRSKPKPWWRRRKDTLGLDDLMPPASQPVRRHGTAVRFAAWAGAVAVVALSAGSLVAPGAIAFSAATDSVLDLWEELPGELPLDTALPQHTVLLDKDGKEFARFYSENRIDVDLNHVSETFRNTLLSTEDSRFYEHHGVDPMGVTRAIVTNSVGGERQGGSTITQQLVQNILVNNARDDTEQSVAVGETYNAKIREAKYAVQLENRLDKDQILNMYVNAVYFGHRAYGVQAAARIYFNTTADKLNLPQSALLVGLLKGPVYYDPMKYPEPALDRRNTVLDVLQRRGAITPDEAAAARQSGLGLDPGSVPSGCADSDYPFYCDLVRDEILSDPAFGKTQEERADRLSRGGMTLTTAMDRKAMAAAQKAVSKAMGNKNRVALGTAVVEPGTGHIAAVVQNRAWGEGKGKTEVVFADSPFQVGSAMKPIVLATALSQGISPRTEAAGQRPLLLPVGQPAGRFPQLRQQELRHDRCLPSRPRVGECLLRAADRAYRREGSRRAGREAGHHHHPQQEAARQGGVAGSGRRTRFRRWRWPTPTPRSSAAGCSAGRSPSPKASAATPGRRSRCPRPAATRPSTLRWRPR